VFPAVFLDRDGVIVENRADYVRRWSDVAFLPHSLDALARVATSGHKVLIVTNQSAVGRGLISLAEAEAINRRIVAAIELAGGRIDGVYMCPHAPAELCACRKPRPGLILQAARDHDVALRRSILVGDSLTDLLAGRAAGVGRLALVRTGLGAEQAHLPAALAFDPLPLFDSLGDALARLLAPPATIAGA
jgi:D-glycero-D-manno-heptose 1,7-bisphosphate phosphatase